MTARDDENTELRAVREALAAEYEVLQELGRGGMAVVYRARDITLGRDVAIKVLPFSIALDPAVVERFQREARTAAQLEHPHVVPIYRVGRSGQVIYFVMQLLRGQSLGDRLLEHGKLDPEMLRRLLLEVGGALGYASSRGVVHRDVKPDNIMLDSDGRAVVTDFGIARSASESRLTATGMSVGTPRYMSPEQARAKPMDGRSDLYSLGVVAYEALTGKPPFDGEDPFAILMAHINAPVPQPPLKTPEERGLFAVIQRMLEKEPGKRFQSADEMIAALQGPGAPVARVSSPASRPSRARKPLAPTAPADAVSIADSPDADDSPGSAGLAALAQRTTVRALEAGRRVRRWSVSRGRRFWLAAAGAAGALVLVYWSGHFLIAHRSHCPAAKESTTPAESTSSAGSKSTASATKPLTLLVDAVSPASPGDEIDVYYDVCGLPEDARFTTNVEVVRSQSSIRRLLGGGTAPVIRRFDEKASSEATRRHRDVDLGALPPGNYAIKVSVTDERGRRRERSVPLQITQ